MEAIAHAVTERATDILFSLAAAREKCQASGASTDTVDVMLDCTAAVLAVCAKATTASLVCPHPPETPLESAALSLAQMREFACELARAI